MSCVFQEIVANVDCNSNGGLAFGYAIPNSEITDVTFDANGKLTALTIAGIGVVTKFNTFDDDDTSKYSQLPTGDGKKEEYSQEAYLKFSKVTSAKVEAANLAAGCCEGSTWIWFLNDGSVLVQGLDYFKALTRWKFTKKVARIKPSVDSQTGADESFVAYDIKATALTLIPVDESIITEAYMDAL